MARRSYNAGRIASVVGFFVLLVHQSFEVGLTLGGPPIGAAMALALGAIASQPSALREPMESPEFRSLARGRV